MKLTTGSFFSIALASSSLVAAANQANIILSPAPSQNEGAPPQISAEQSALIYAQRLDLTDNLSLGQASSETIDLINRFGSHGGSLFDDGSREEKTRWLAIVEGVVDMNAVLPPRFGDPGVAFTVDNPPSLKSNQKLIDDLAAHGSSCKGCRKINVKGLERYEQGVVTVGKSHMVHVNELQDILAKQSSDSSEYQTALLSIRTMLTSLLDSNADLSIVLMPPSKESGMSGLFSKAPSSYGTSHLAKHKRNSAQHHRANKPRQQKGSAGGRIDINPDTNAQGLPDDLDTDTGFASPSDLDNETYVNEDAKAQMNSDDPPPPPPPPPPPADAQQDGPKNNGSSPRGILPVCYSNLEDCQRVTFNCSGHGSCRQKYSTEGQHGCFACECKATVQGEGKNTQTTFWGGPACQKQDVSMPFWLLAGVTIGLISMIGWGIGLLVSMGGEDLPSVIGAGVAGPRPK